MITASLSGMKKAVIQLNKASENIANIDSSSHENKNIDATETGSKTKPAVVYNIKNPESKITSKFPQDYAIKGKGYFSVITQGNQLAFTKDGSFELDNNGNVITSSGSMLIPPLTIPDNVIQADINKKGVIQAIDENNNVLKIGQITLTEFENEDSLNNIGNNLKIESNDSGEKNIIIPDGITSSIDKKTYNSSDISISEELVNQIKAERSFEGSAEALKTENDMMGTVIDLTV